jgi:hypothetical protein
MEGTPINVDAFIELEDADLDAALAGSKERGIYETKLIDFFGSGKRGVQINLAGGTHANKKANSVKTGYETAREKLETGKAGSNSWNELSDDERPAIQEAAKNTKVAMREGKVFLVRTDIASSAQPAAAATA